MTTPLRDIPLKTIDGKDAKLADYAGQVLLIVNVASKCGLTPQYDALEQVYERFRGRGFAVLGFPANDFAGQEPGSDAEILTFCRTNFSVAFPMFSKISVVGPQRHPLYSALTAAQPKSRPDGGSAFRERLAGHGIAANPEPEILWNFEKFLVSADGRVIDRFAPDVPPDDPRVVAAIEQALAG